ncbi:DegT/DnrJ/EryC1/StrS family aminotransferase [Streptomyces acidiscabies]|uniref:DegT/DnrJ/EryC1/StrS family aminotransferase n=1 Tax=Streptomyces acidiscabies TaxID=42234 RepID=UPI000959123E|nr:DegT/DnrJ/EryC1/StrS family aminotransferase [Streptomyces acidiscabies]GAV38287.1 UDP-4-amino-4-deoxy-L-arabinose--oxoglutarate [Streptomyces acidiscabies]
MTIPIWRTHLSRTVRRHTHLEVAELLKTGRMIDGPLTERLEQAVGSAFGRHAVAVSSGMDALELLLETAEVWDRDVLIPANCFPSIPALVDQLWARPQPVLVDPVHLAMTEDVTDLAVNARRPVVVWVHHAGIVAPYARRTIEALRELGCTVIEDCAYLLPDDEPKDGPGTWGDMALFSYAPTKPLGGDGGAVVLLRDALDAQKVSGRRSHSGQERRWASGDRFLRGRTITEFAAAVAYWQWRERADTRDALRKLADAYVGSFEAADCPALPAGRTPQTTWGRFSVDLATSDLAARARARMAENGIATTVMFDRPWTDFPALTDDLPPDNDLRHLLRRTVCIPYHPTLHLTDVHCVAEFITATLTRGGPR